MYAYLNDLSIAPAGFAKEKILALLNEFIGVFSCLRDYQIEKLRVPKGFTNENLIFGTTTIKDLVKSLSGETDYDIRTRIVTFLNNVEESRPNEHDERLNLAQRSKLIEVSYQEVHSDMLSEAYLLAYPLVSVKSRPDFDVHFLPCEVLELNLVNEATKTISLPNLFDLNSVNHHHGLLLKIHHDSMFAKKKWIPFENPSWRTDVTKDILILAKYPGNRNQLSVAELRSLNMNAAELVLIANGWTFNRVITNYNRHKPYIWRVYSNSLTSENVYISVDLGEGEFEIQDRRGHWKATRFFNGNDTGKNYSGDNTHGIIIKS